MNVEGKLHLKMDTVQVSDTFKRRGFVVEYTDNPLYPQFVSFELTQDRTTLIDNLNVGDLVEITFNLKGREWTSPQGEVKYFNTLEAWRVQKADATAIPQSQASAEAVAAGMTTADFDDPGDDLPF